MLNYVKCNYATSKFISLIQIEHEYFMKEKNFKNVIIKDLFHFINKLQLTILYASIVHLCNI